MIFSNTLLHWCIQGMTDRKILSFSKTAITTCAPEHFCTLRIGDAPALGRSEMLRGEKGRRGEPGWSPHALGLLLHCPRAAQAVAGKMGLLGVFSSQQSDSFPVPALRILPTSRQESQPRHVQMYDGFNQVFKDKPQQESLGIRCSHPFADVGPRFPPPSYEWPRGIQASLKLF